MSTCILTGFAKKKRRQGTSYACDGSDLPATQDLGTSIYQGPFEAAQTVPATEVTYTIIGYTPCGDTIRRISTKTYSSRAVPNQYKEVASFLREPFQPAQVAATGTFYGSTQSAALQALAVANIGAVPDPYTFFAPPGSTYLYTGKKDGGVGFGIDYTTATENGNPVTSVLWQSFGQTQTFPITIYYLDVNEVLTYDLV